MLQNFFTWTGSWFVNTLSWWQWLILAAVPPAIIALYFLKLKRQPLEVPSTYLWHKSIEDLHVNSIWQRLRRNLLLLLQLLLLLLVMLALLRPNWQTRRATGQRFIFLIDNSASMQATDVGPSRLEEAKRRVRQRIENDMDTGDAAMIISFSDTPRVVQTFTDDRSRLVGSLEKIEPTQRGTSLLEALKVASGLANPGRSAEDAGDDLVAEAMPADLLIFSDGKFPPVADFTLGHLKPIFVPISDPAAANVGIVAFDVRPSEADPELAQAFARLENFGQDDVSVLVELFRHGDDQPIDADRVEIAPGKARGVTFDLGAVQSGVLQLKLDTGDDLALDDRAWTVIRPPQRAKVLLVTLGNEPLELALKTALATDRADVRIETPDFLKDKIYRDRAAAGVYDLVIYDRCAPRQAESPDEGPPDNGPPDNGPPDNGPLMPQANTLFIGSLPPPRTGWSAGPKVDVPEIIDVEASHPLLQWIDLSDVSLLEGTPLKPPPSGGVLIDSDQGPMMAITPRERFEDAVLGFVILDEVVGDDGQKSRLIGTDWMTRQSFPVFVLNVIDYLGGRRRASHSGGVQPGRPAVLKAPAPHANLRVRTPSAEKIDLQGDPSGKAVFAGTEELGVYEVQSDGTTLQPFVVNLFHAAESNIRPEKNPIIKIGYVEVEGQSGWETTRREIWKWLLGLGLVVLLLEWYIYNRRVYL